MSARECDDCEWKKYCEENKLEYIWPCGYFEPVHDTSDQDVDSMIESGRDYYARAWREYVTRDE